MEYPLKWTGQEHVCFNGVKSILPAQVKIRGFVQNLSIRDHRFSFQMAKLSAVAKLTHSQ